MGLAKIHRVYMIQKKELVSGGLGVCVQCQLFLFP